MEYKFKLSAKQHFMHLDGALPFVFVGLVGPMYLAHREGSREDYLYYWFSLICFLVFVLPLVLLHLRYYFLNRGRNLDVSAGLDNFNLRLKNGSNVEFSIDDIESIVQHQSFSYAEKRMRWLAFDDYNYSIIRLKNGKSFIITSLLVPNFEIPVSEEVLRIRKRFYCYPYSAKEVL